MSQATPRGELFILSAPSGTGKTTLIRSLMEGDLGEFGGCAFAVSHTTRKPRESEVDGEDYHFVDGSTFRRMIDEEQFLEWEVVHNQHYGTSLLEVLPRLEQGIDVLVDIDVKGAQRIMRLYPDRHKSPLLTAVHSIFIMPPSYADLERRLRRRDLDEGGEIERRLAVSRDEMRQSEHYHYVIVNDDAVRASHVLAAIILEKRHRFERMRGRLGKVLEDFSCLAPSSAEDDGD